jgi:hypothetical protein
MNNNLINTEMDTKDINKKILELKLKSHVENVKLEIQKLAQLADDNKEKTKTKNNVKQ